jgi:hypothetical protein
MSMALVEEDVETQQKGTVAIFYQCNPLTKVLSRSEERAMVRRLLSGLPMRFSSCHVCLPNSPLLSLVKAMVLATVDTAKRARTRFHKGERESIPWVWVCCLVSNKRDEKKIKRSGSLSFCLMSLVYAS